MGLGLGGSPTSPPLPTINSSLVSDVLNLGRTGSSGSPIHTDPFVLQMTYDQVLLSNELSQTAEGSLFSLAKPNRRPWRKAALAESVLGDIGNIATPTQRKFQGSFAAFQTAFNDTNLSDYIGAWGVDTSHHDVWAVLNHNSDFAVITEPSCLSLAWIGGLMAGGFMMGQRRKAVTTSEKAMGNPIAFRGTWQ